MNLTWQNINADVPILQDRPGIETGDLLDSFVQADSAIPNPLNASGFTGAIPQWWDPAITVAIAAAILIVGFLVAWSVSLVAEGLLKRTQLDNKIAVWIAGASDSSSAPPVEKWVGAGVFWLIMLLVLVARMTSFISGFWARCSRRFILRSSGPMPSSADKVPPST